MTTHPYIKYASLKAWNTLKNALNELENNQDLEKKTNSDYIIGYLIKSLDDKGILLKSEKEKNINVKIEELESSE